MDIVRRCKNLSSVQAYVRHVNDSGRGSVDGKIETKILSSENRHRLKRFGLFLPTTVRGVLVRFKSQEGQRTLGLYRKYNRKESLTYNSYYTLVFN